MNATEQLKTDIRRRLTMPAPSSSPEHVARVRAAAQVLRDYRRQCDAAAEDLDAFHAPSECFTLVNNSLRRRLTDSLRALGFEDEGAAVRAIVGVTSEKWAHFNVKLYHFNVEF